MTKSLKHKSLSTEDPKEFLVFIPFHNPWIPLLPLATEKDK